MGLPESDGNAIVELTGEEGAGEVVENVLGAEVVLEPEAGEVELGLAGEPFEVGDGVLAEVAGVGGIFANDLEGAAADEHAEAFAQANGVGSLEHERAAGTEPRSHTGENLGGGGVEMLDDFGHDDDVVGFEDGPGCGVGRMVEVEVDVLAAHLARETVVKIAYGIDGGLWKGLLEEKSLMGEADIEDALTTRLALLDPLDGLEEELVAPVMET